MPFLSYKTLKWTNTFIHKLFFILPVLCVECHRSGIYAAGIAVSAAAFVAAKCFGARTQLNVAKVCLVAVGNVV